MAAEAWLTLTVLAICFGFLIFTRLSADVVLFAGLIVLLCTGVLKPSEALAGFANEGLMTIAMMYIVATGLRETGGVELLVRHLLGRPASIIRAQLRLMLPVTLMSAFMNNTPLVATFIPAVLSWSKRLQISPSKLLLPLSYAAILGGTCTLIGTSTNLVVNGLLTDSHLPGLTLFEIAWVGVPVAITGLAYILLAGHWLLPERIPATATYENPKEYTVEMQVAAKGPLVGKTVEEAGLRHLQGLFLVEIERDGRIIAAVGAKERLRADDRLVFVGVTESVVELQRIKGLRASVERTYNIKEFYPERCLVEAVVSPRCALLNETIRDGRFRTYYGATVIAVSRNGHRINGKVGNIRLQTADTLLLETRPSFIQRHRDSKDFLLISTVADSSPLRFERGWLAWLILGVLVLSAGVGWLSMLKASLLGAMAMLLTGCCTLTAARRGIDTQVLLAIAAAFGLGKALESSGAATALSSGVLDLVGHNPWLVLIAVYLITSALTEIVTNNAVAVMMFTIVIATAESLTIDPLPLVIAVMMGASASFATPIGYQTNLMVYGVGGYRFGDFLRIGIPLNLLAGIITVAIIPWVWTLHSL